MDARLKSRRPYVVAALSCVGCAFGGHALATGDVLMGVLSLAGGVALSIVGLMLASLTAPDPALWSRMPRSGPRPSAATRPNS